MTASPRPHQASGLTRRTVLIHAASVATAGVAWARPGSPSGLVQAELRAELSRLMTAWRTRSDPEDGIAALEAALKLLPLLDHWRNPTFRDLYAADIYLELGTIYGLEREKGDRADNTELGLGFLRKSIRIHGFADLHGRAVSELVFGTVLFRRGTRNEDTRSAIAALHRALSVLGRTDSPGLAVKGQELLGYAYLTIKPKDLPENLENARSAFESMLDLADRDVDLESIAGVKVSLGHVYLSRKMGDPSDNKEAVIAHCTDALQIAEARNLEDTSLIARLNLSQAYASRYLGDPVDNRLRAIAISEQGLARLPADDRSYQWAVFRTVLANAYLDANTELSYEDAIAESGLALDVFVRLEAHLDVAKSEIRLGMAYAGRRRDRRSDNLRRAIGHFQTAMLMTQDRYPEVWASALAQVASAFLDEPTGDVIGNIDRAARAYADILGVVTQVSDPYLWAHAQLGLARCGLKRVVQDGSLERSRAEALRLVQLGIYLALETFKSRSAPHQHLDCLVFLASVRLLQRDWTESARTFRNARHMFLRISRTLRQDGGLRDLIAKGGRLYSDAAFVAAEIGDLETALGLVSEGRARMLDLTLRRRSPGFSISERARVAELAHEIGELTRRLEVAKGGTVEEFLNRLAPLQRQLDTILDGVTAREPQPKTTQLAGEILADGGILATLIVSDAGIKLLLAWLERGTLKLRGVSMPDLTKDRLDAFFKGPAAGEGLGGWLGQYQTGLKLNDLKLSIAFYSRFPYLPKLAELRNSYRDIEDQWLRAIDDLGSSLWRLIGADLAKAARDVGLQHGQRLVWLPTDALGIVPLGLALDPESGIRLGELYDIVYQPSLSAAVANKVRNSDGFERSSTVIGYAGTDLPFAKLEAVVVASYFQDNINRVDDGNPSTVLSALPTGNYWHFACHGEFNHIDASRSKLTLSSRKQSLTVGELIDASENGGLSAPRLVFLSACETGLYDVSYSPNEFTGLPNAFMALGAVAVIGTIWSVPDDATTMLVARFYELHIVEGLAPSRSLREAQSWLKSRSIDDLATYVTGLARSGRLDTSGAKRLMDRLEALAVIKSSRDICPFEHPYNWAAFVYYGL